MASYDSWWHTESNFSAVLCHVVKPPSFTVKEMEASPHGMLLMNGSLFPMAAASVWLHALTLSEVLLSTASHITVSYVESKITILISGISKSNLINICPVQMAQLCNDWQHREGEWVWAHWPTPYLCAIAKLCAWSEHVEEVSVHSLPMSSNVRKEAVLIMGRECMCGPSCVFAPCRKLITGGCVCVLS